MRRDGSGVLKGALARVGWAVATAGVVGTSSGCTGLFTSGVALANLSLDSPIRLDSSLFLGVAVAFLPVDIVLTYAMIEGDFELTYLERNRREIMVAVARGEGPFVSDLAYALGFDEEATRELGAALREARAEVVRPLSEPGPIDRARRDRFVAALVEVIASRPDLEARARTVQR